MHLIYVVKFTRINARFGEILNAAVITIIYNAGY